jgi:hypothetical protein
LFNPSVEHNLRPSPAVVNLLVENDRSPGFAAGRPGLRRLKSVGLGWTGCGESRVRVVRFAAEPLPNDEVINTSGATVFLAAGVALVLETRTYRLTAGQAVAAAAANSSRFPVEPSPEGA